MHPPDRSWNVSESTARELHNHLKQFRREWAQFALQSRPSYDAFREKGAALPDNFMKGVADLAERKTRLHAKISQATAKIPRERWQLSSSDADLEQLEQDLERLRTLCRQQEEQFRTWLKTIQLPLETAAQLQSSSAEVRSLVDPLKVSSTRVIQQLEDIPSLDCDQAESTCGVITPLLRLVSDQQQRRQPDYTPALLNDVEQWFQQVETVGGRKLAIAALRGDVTLDETPLQDFVKHATSPARHGSTVTADQIVRLQKNLAATNDRVEPTAVKPSITAATGNQPPTSSKDAAAELLPVIQNLTRRSHSLREEHGISPETPQHPLYLRAMGLENLKVATQVLLELLKARETNRQDYRSQIEESVQLLAEAQSAVREDYAAGGNGPGILPEQDAVFRWLKGFVSEDAESILVARFMKLDDGARPADNTKLATRLRQFEKNIRHRTRNHALQRSLDSLVRKAVQQRASDAHTDIWPSLQQVTLELLATGTNPASASLRDQLLKVLDELPDSNDTTADLHDDFRTVLRHLEDYHDEQLERSLEAAPRSAKPSADLLQVRQWLKGKTVALVAGVMKPEHQQRIEQELRLKSLIWIPASKTDRVADLRPQLRNASLVIFITKLMGHKHSDLRACCDEHNIPWVQTKKSQGYGVNVLVDVIMNQASRQLDRAG